MSVLGGDTASLGVLIAEGQMKSIPLRSMDGGRLSQIGNEKTIFVKLRDVLPSGATSIRGFMGKMML